MLSPTDHADSGHRAMALTRGVLPCGVDNDLRSADMTALAEEVASLHALTARLNADNARLLRLLELTPKQASRPGPAQTRFLEAAPGPVNRESPPEVKVDFSLRCSPPAPISMPCGGRTRALAS